MSTSQICILLTIVVYLVAMVLVGVYCSRKGGGDSSNEFYLGGRKLGPIVTAMSAEASDMSSYLLMGLPGLAYLSGVAEVGWTALGLAIGTYLNWLIVAKRLRRYTAKVGAITIPSFFSRRYQDQRNVLSCIAAVVILIFFIPYTASGFKAIGTLFNSLFGVDYHTTMIIGAAVVIGYTVLGGFLAVSTTDLIQSIIMTFALIFIVLFGIQQAGGWELVASNASSLPGFLNMTQGYDPATGQASSYGGLSIVSTLAWGLGYFGMPHILLRFMAIEDEKKLVLSRRIASVWVVIAMTASIVIGVGLADNRPGVCVERVAVNVADFPIRDNEGYLALNETLDPGGPVAYLSTLPIRACVSELREAGLPAQVSNTAGNFCCNMVMYSALNYIAKHKLNARAGFVHVPYTPEMVAKKAEQLSTMSFENMKRAVEVVAKASVDYEQDISLVCGACS